MAFEYAKAALGEAVVKQCLNYISNDPEKNLVNILRWGETIVREPVHKEYCRTWQRMLSDKDNNWRKLIVRLLGNVAPEVKTRFLVNFFINAGIAFPEKQREAEKKYGVHIPWAILIDPTGRCNLRCKGCWAADYDRTLDMDYSTLDRVISEAERLGIHMFIVSGGEPTVVMDELLELASTHPESDFHAFTNGTLITKDVAQKVAKVGNISFAISIEGLEDATDARRGKGVFKKVMQAMDNLREAGVLFGFSATYTRLNTDEIGSDQFIDLMVDKGCALGWLFTYVPVGGGVDLDYMATPEQRAFMYRQVRKWRAEKPILVADFWNDGELVGGCIAGGRCYFHINSSGDVEPCAFIHYSNVNIKNTSLLEALKSPLFLAYQRNQPFNGNQLRPCPLIDNPECLEAMVVETKAHSTQKNGVSAPELCRPLHDYATKWAEVADPIWEEGHQGKSEAGETPKAANQA